MVVCLRGRVGRGRHSLSTKAFLLDGLGKACGHCQADLRSPLLQALHIPRDMHLGSQPRLTADGWFLL